MLSTYRPEIDGLRAISVTAVVLYHAHMPGLGGGFAGVDIFFVLSGYLITQIILRDFDSDRFSLAEFYERRVRRIMPALFATLAVSTVASLMLLPDDLKHYSESLIAVVLFLSNGFFWHESSSYFAAAAETMPLLHTWSLAVEEQFYLVFPAFILVARRYGKLATAICFVGIGSFFFGAWLGDSTFAFYAPFTRAWELMLGAVLAIKVLPLLDNPHVNDLLSAGGLLLVLASVMLLNSSMPYPGYAALAPCAGVALILYGSAAHRGFTARTLSLRPLVAVGLMSYSLYLWHWPLLTFGTYYIVNPQFLPIARALLVFVSLPIAYLSWRYIETPFRGPSAVLSRPKVFAWALRCSIAMAFLGLVGVASNGLGARFGSSVGKMLAERSIPSFNPCHDQAVISILNGVHCSIGAAKGSPVFVVWGDSHADMYHDVLDQLGRRYSVAGILFSSSACPPIVGGDSLSGTPHCAERNAAIIAQIKAIHPAAVFMVGRWIRYIGSPQDVQNVQIGLEKTIAQISTVGATTYFVSDIPDTPNEVEDQMAKASVLGIDLRGGAPSFLNVNPTGTDYLRTVDNTRQLVGGIRYKLAVEVIDPASFMCDARGCRVTNGDGTLLYRNSRHLSRAGALYVGAAFKSALQQLSVH